jgi:L-fucose isomerase-like protein
MKTINTTTIAALPIGEFDTDLVKNEFDAIIRAFNHPTTNLIVADAVSDEEAARQSTQVLSEKRPDLLLIIVLRGLSARAIETAALLSHVPVLIWPIQGRHSLPSSTLAVGALQESRVPVELLYTPPDYPDSLERLQLITRAARAFSQIHQSRIGIIGDLFPNLISCRYDPQIVSSRLGTTLVSISYKEIRDSIQSISQHIREIEQLRQEIAMMCIGSEVDGNALDAGLRLHLALKQVALEQKIDGFATECWSGFPRELGLNPCMGFIEDAYVLACEGDVMLCLSLLMVRYLTGTNAYVGDLYDLDMDGILTLTHCGAPASLASNKREVVLAKSQLALERGFETITCQPRLNRGTVTLFRFYGSECNQLHMTLGELLGSELSPNLTVKVKVNGNRQNFLEQCFGNHYLMVSGDIRSELKLLGKWMSITIHET